MPIWNKKAETMPRDELEQVQLERLQAVVNRVYRNVRFYRRKFDQLGITPEDIRDLADIKRLPLTTKDDLRDSYPYEMFAVGLREIVRIHSSAGTTGKPTVCGYTRNDLKTWSELVARVLSAGGITKDDVVQVSFGYGISTSGFGLHYGAELIGASVIPVSSGNVETQIQVLQDFRTTALVGTPSYALYIAETLEEMGISPASLSLRVGLFGSEPFSESMRREIETRLSISATDNYSISEVIGPGVSGECELKNGLHINEDHFIPEIIDPSTGEQVGCGEEGELVLTTVTKEAFPLLRYRTRDIVSLMPDPCPCGRTFVRMSRVHGRTDDVIIIRGMKVLPSQIETCLFEIENVEPHYQIVVERVGALDEMTLLVEVSEDIFADRMDKMIELEERIRSRVGAVIGLTPRVKLVEPKTIERSLGKSRRVIDNREL